MAHVQKPKIVCRVAMHRQEEWRLMCRSYFGCRASLADRYRAFLTTYKSCLLKEDDWSYSECWRVDGFVSKLISNGQKRYRMNAQASKDRQFLSGQAKYNICSYTSSTHQVKNIANNSNKQAERPALILPNWLTIPDKINKVGHSYREYEFRGEAPRCDILVLLMISERIDRRVKLTQRRNTVFLEVRFWKLGEGMTAAICGINTISSVVCDMCTSPSLMVSYRSRVWFLSFGCMRCED